MPKPAVLLAAPVAVAAENVTLSDVLAELRALRQDVMGHRVTVPADEVLVALLAAIYTSIGDRVFSAADLLIHAALPVAADLHAAILAAIGVANARKLGKAFARIEGHDLGGLRVTRVASDSTGILWCVHRVL